MNASIINIKQVFESFQTGNETAFDFYFHSHYKSLCFFVRRYMQDAAAAEDTISECFFQLWKSREKIESERHLRNWLYKTAYRLCLDQLAKEKTRKKHADALRRKDQEPIPDHSEQIIRAETLREMRVAMDQLPTQCKTIFYKLYVEGKTVKETANELALSISTVHNQRTRGIKLLKQKLSYVFFYILLFSFF
ncbi:MAG: sigma-70 family RNA polymerase sigma factor [Chitinophagaceae bacterium]